MGLGEHFVRVFQLSCIDVVTGQKMVGCFLAIDGGVVSASSTKLLRFKDLCLL